MPRVPAICNTCGTIFPSGFSVGARNVSLEDCITASCPHCGGVGQVPSGVYSALTSTALAVTAGNISESQLQRFLSILKDARKCDASPDDVAKSIRSDVPELRTISDVLPKTRSEMYAFITMLIVLLSTLLNALKPSDKSPSISEDRVQQIVDESIEKLYRDKHTPPASPSIAPSDKHKVARNAPCPCGSGKKFKRCCGK